MTSAKRRLVNAYNGCSKGIDALIAIRENKFLTGSDMVEVDKMLHKLGNLRRHYEGQLNRLDRDRDSRECEIHKGIAEFSGKIELLKHKYEIR